MRKGLIKLNERRKEIQMRIKKWMTLVVAFAMAFTVIGFGLATDDVSAAAKAPTKLTLKST